MTQEAKTAPDDGGQAFPMPEGGWDGMSLRDYFAGKAMAALLIDPERADQSREECARLSYLMADAMLAARRTP